MLTAVKNSERTLPKGLVILSEAKNLSFGVEATLPETYRCDGRCFDCTPLRSVPLSMTVVFQAALVL